MKTIIKRIVGMVVILHIFPISFIGITMIKGGIGEYGYLIPYAVGLVANMVVALCFGLFRFLNWCFD